MRDRTEDSSSPRVRETAQPAMVANRPREPGVLLPHPALWATFSRAREKEKRDVCSIRCDALP